MSRTIFKRANLVDGTNPPKPDMTVIVDGNLIDQVTSGDVTVSPEDRIVDLGGKTIMPGMYVCHFHAEYRFIDLTRLQEIYIGTERPAGMMMAVALQSCQNLLDSGFTGFAGGACSFDIDAQLKMCVEEGIITGPRILPASRHINTTGHDNDRAKWWYDMQNKGADIFADGPEELRKAVRSEINRGAEIIKIFPTGGHGVVQARNVRGLTHSELLAVVEAAHERGVKVRAHCVWRDSIVECINAGVDVIDHGDEIDQEIIDLMVENGTFWTPSMLFLKVLLGASPDQALDEQVSPIAHDWQNIVQMLPIANHAGVNIVLGDDYGLEIIPHLPGIYAREMSIYANECGVKPLDVIRWATRNGAKLCGLEGKAGAVIPGAFADLVIVNDDPTQDISLLEDPGKNISAVMVDGVFAKDQLSS
jgi:imidazolonepropionase-like amidohydrolase